MTNLQEAADLNDTVTVSARRFEESPFISRQDTSKMVRGVYADRFHRDVDQLATLQKSTISFFKPST